jgi:glutathione S-transferase
MCVYGFLAGFVYAGASRRETFNDAWRSSPAGLALQAEHKAAVGDAIAFSPAAYPDVGSGRYAATLPYAAWLKFNMAQRAHYNLVEIFAPTLGLQVLAGVFYPLPAAALALPWIAARHVWSTNYMTSGPEARYSGIAGLSMLSVLGWTGLAIAGSVKMIGSLPKLR